MFSAFFAFSILLSLFSPALRRSRTLFMGISFLRTPLYYFSVCHISMAFVSLDHLPMIGSYLYGSWIAASPSRARASSPEIDSFWGCPFCTYREFVDDFTCFDTKLEFPLIQVGIIGFFYDLKAHKAKEWRYWWWYHTDTKIAKICIYGWSVNCLSYSFSSSSSSPS
jgi:hypothetical protein